MDEFNFLETFELLYSQNANNAPGLEQEEIQIFLDQAQIKVWEMFVTAFDGNEKARLVLDKLINKSNSILIDNMTLQQYLISSSRVVSDVNDKVNVFPIDPYEPVKDKNIVYETVTVVFTPVSGKEIKRVINVIPVNFDYKYQFLKLNPFRIPDTRFAYRCKDELFVNNSYEKLTKDTSSNIKIIYEWSFVDLPSSIDLENNTCDLDKTVWYNIVETAVTIAQQTMLTRQTNN